MRTDKIIVVANTPSSFRSESNVYDVNGISPTLTARDYKGPVKVLIKNATKKGYLIAEEGDGIDTAYPDSKTRRGRVQKNMAHTITTDDSKGVVIGTIYTNVSKRFQRGVYKNLSRTVKANNHDLSVVIAASRGRDPKNPSDRRAGNINLQQRLEINENGTSNTITSVQKDNYAVELPEYRIRKLTPKECWRLMGCSDKDFHKAEQVNSNTQLYKQAGNAIVVNVLEAIFKQMFLKELVEE